MGVMRTISAALIVLFSLLGSHAIHFSTDDLIEPVPVQLVKLAHNSQFDKAISLNKEYLLGLDIDRLLKTFRVNAGLDAPGEFFSGSWEDPGCEVRGQYMGHWLSGTAVLGKYSGDKEVVDRASFAVTELRKVQQALGGYLSAFPAEHFDRLRRFEGVWAPFYVIHKIMAGLLDQYTFLGNQIALQMVVEEAKYFEAYIKDIISHEGAAHWTQMLEIEYGGMEELLFNLFDITKDERWSKMAVYFTKPNFFKPLTKGVDTLPNRHANTHLAQVNGFAAGYEKTGDKDRLAAVAHFYDIITHAHTYATGGSNDGEYWQAPHELAPGIYGDGAGRNTEETCTTYNMMKLSRYLFRWSGEAKFVDYYERAVLNGMLGTQRMPAGYVSKNELRPSNHSAADESGTDRRALLEELGTRSQTRVPQVGRSHLPDFKSSASTIMREASNHSLDWRQQAFAKYPGADNGLPEWSNAPGPGVILYLLPLGAGNNKDDNWHHWSTPLNSFWCCSGSTSEQFGRLMDSIYFHRLINRSTPELYINQFTPSTLHWPLGSLDVTLNASLLSHDNVARISVDVTPFGDAAAEEAVVKVRVPGWADASAASARLNGDEAVAGGLTPESYLSIRRVFKAGDRIELELPLRISTEAIDDWRPQFKNLQAVLLGPFLLAALTDGDRRIQADPAEIQDLVKEVPSGGFYSLAAEAGKLLCGSGKGKISLVARADVLSGMECTFRILRRGSSNGVPTLTALEILTAGGGLVIESMTKPGHFMMTNDTGGLMTQPAKVDDVPTWRMEGGGDGSFLAAEASGIQIPGGGRLRIEAAAGAYPEGARLLTGHDKNFILAPLGNIVEERYSPYIEFLPVPSQLAV